MASSGTRWSDQAPATAAAPTSRRTRNLFRTEKSMTLSITTAPGAFSDAARSSRDVHLAWACLAGSASNRFLHSSAQK